jgi:hypothetical protein
MCKAGNEEVLHKHAVGNKRSELCILTHMQVYL